MPQRAVVAMEEEEEKVRFSIRITNIIRRSIINKSFEWKHVVFSARYELNLHTRLLGSMLRVFGPF